MSQPYIADLTHAPPGSEMIGKFIQDWVDNVQRDVTAPIIEHYGITYLDPDGWYPLDIVVDLFADFRQREGGSMALVAMGKASAEPVQNMFQFRSIEDYLERCGEPFRAAIRNIPDEYGLLVEYRGDTVCEITNNSIVPNEMIYGYIWEMCSLITGDGGSFTLAPISGYTPGGTERAVFELEWHQ
jgi:hypothetical protein